VVDRVRNLLRRIAASASLWAGGLGAAAGALFGVNGCGWLVPLILAALAGGLARPGVTALQAAARLAAFSVAFSAAGYAGVALSLPPSWRLLGALPIAAAVAVHAAGAALAGGLAFAWRGAAVVRMAVVLPSLWAALEAVLGMGDAGVPWLRLGLTQASGGPLAGALPYAGALGAGWLMWSVAGLLAVAWRCSQTTRRRACTGAAFIVAATAAAGQVSWTHDAGDLRVALLQPGGPSPSRLQSAEWLLGWYAEQLESATADLIVTPQLALAKTPAALPPGFLARMDASVRARGADALVGMHMPTAEGAGLHNGVVVLGRSGAQVQLKHRLFPFGEFVPLPAAAAARLQAMLPVPVAETARGPWSEAPLLAAGHRVAVAVCWEAAFPDPWRTGAATADLLVNLSSDSALDSPQLARHTRQLVRARVLEFEKPLVRTSDRRGTLAVDHAGRVVDALPSGDPHVLHATVRTRAGLTPYARWGDRVVALWIALSLAIAVVAAEPATAGFPLRRRLAAGQVLPLAAVLLLAIGAMFYLMVNSSQAVLEKLRVTQAADAAAWSAGVAEARALNHDAYLNRAIVANEIAIAQMVSFASWLRYFATASDQFVANAADVDFFLLPSLQVARLDAAFGGSAAAAGYLGGRSVTDFADEVIVAIGTLVSAHDVAARALSLAQQAVHANLAGGARQQRIAQTVAQATDPALRADILPASHGFDTFTHAYASAGAHGDERGRLADVVLRSRDAFTRERNWTVESADIPFLRQDAALKKRGGTDLVGYDEWRAVDTLELHGQRWGCGKFGLSWCDDIRRPIGWGAVAVRAGGTADARGRHGNAYGDNPTTAALADADLREPPTATFSGLPDTRDVADADPARVAVTGVTVRVAKPLAATRTAGRAARVQPAGRLALFGGDAVIDEVAALSRAEVYFDRIAARADGKAELGGLYNPYWRVRLAAPTTSDRADAAARQGGLVLP
jgi:apolipoprotein N-acyltransferase